MFKCNEVVVYRKEVYRIAEIKKGSSKEDTYYVLVPYVDDDGSLRVQVPCANKMGYLRKLSTVEEIKALIDRIPSISIVSGNNRIVENEYKNLLKNPTLDDLVSIIKTTYLRNKERTEQKKKASVIDQKYFKEAERMLYQEIGAVLNLSVEEAKNHVIAAIESQK